MITSTATNQRGKFSIITYGYVIILSLLKVRLHTAIRRVRLVFWRIQSSRQASIVHLKFHGTDNMGFLQNAHVLGQKFEMKYVGLHISYILHISYPDQALR